jgi:hypothetical protein
MCPLVLAARRYTAAINNRAPDALLTQEQQAVYLQDVRYVRRWVWVTFSGSSRF